MVNKFKQHTILYSWQTLVVSWAPLNPLSPSIHVQILLSDLYTFP